MNENNTQNVIPNVDSKSREERNVPDLRFCEFNDLYQEIQFKNAFKLLRGSSPRPIIEYITNNVNDPYWIKIGDMPEYDFIVNCVKEHISLEGAKHSRAVYKGDMILSNSMSYGKPYILNIDGYIHDGWFVIREYSDHFKRDYLMYILSSPCVQKRYSQIAAGGVVQNISSDLVNSVKVKIPNKEEQIKVADFLNKIDVRILTQKKIIDLLESQINQIRKQLIDNMEQSNVFISLNKIIEEYTNKTNANNMYPVLSSTKSGIHLQSEYFNKDASSDDTTGYKIIPKGYCTYRSMSDTGEFTFNIQNVIENGIVSPAYPVFTTKYLNEFVVEYLNNSSKIRNNILSLKEGGTRFALSLKKLMNLEIPHVTLNEQNEFLKALDKFNIKIKNEKQILSLYEQQKQYLLDKMFI